MPNYDPKSVRALFNEMTGTYGAVNLASSFGFAARWRRQSIAGIPSTTSVSRIADLMSGMGELWRSVSLRFGAATEVVAVDISEEMVRRSPRIPPCSVTICVEDVLAFCPPSQSFDAVVSSFGLKTFNLEQQQRLAAQVGRILRPGGGFSFVEISVPSNRALRLVYMFYVKRIIPLVGRTLLGNAENYRLLGVYTEAFGTCSHFADCLRRLGLQVTFVRYFFGCATGVVGCKPESTA